MSFHHDVPSHLIYKPPFPSTSFTNTTNRFDGANTGLSREAATNFVGLGAAKVTLAVRPYPENEPQGEVTDSTIETATRVTGVVKVYHLD